MSQPTDAPPNPPAPPSEPPSNGRPQGRGSTPFPDPGHIDEGLNEVILILGGLRVTFRLARLIALFWLSMIVILLCFWVILEPNTPPQIDTLCGNLVVTIVTAWIAAIAAGGGMRG